MSETTEERNLVTVVAELLAEQKALVEERDRLAAIVLHYQTVEAIRTGRVTEFSEGITT